MTVLAFRPISSPGVDEDRACAALPGWVTSVGYTPVAFQKPELGQLFYDPVRDKVLRCIEDIETHPFVILEYWAVRKPGAPNG